MNLRLSATPVHGVGVGTGPDDLVWEQPIGWRLAGTDRWWPAMLGPPPPGTNWEPIYRG